MVLLGVSLQEGLDHVMVLELFNDYLDSIAAAKQFQINAVGRQPMGRDNRHL